MRVKEHDRREARSKIRSLTTLLKYDGPCAACWVAWISSRQSDSTTTFRKHRSCGHFQSYSLSNSDFIDTQENRCTCRKELSFAISYHNSQSPPKMACLRYIRVYFEMDQLLGSVHLLFGKSIEWTKPWIGLKGALDFCLQKLVYCGQAKCHVQ